MSISQGFMCIPSVHDKPEQGPKSTAEEWEKALAQPLKALSFSEGLGSIPSPHKGVHIDP